jgi:hypothetical protein
MNKTKKIKKLKKRLKTLESIITGSSITLVNSSNPNEKMIIKYEDDTFSTVNEITTTQVKPLESIDNLNRVTIKK